LPTGSLVPAANCPAGEGNQTPQVDGCLTINVPDTSGGIAPGGGSVTYTGTFLTTAKLDNTAKNSVSVTASSSNTGSPQNVDGSADWGTSAGSCGPIIISGLLLSKKCETCLQSTGSALQ